MPYATAHPMRVDAIPVVDLTPLRDNTDCSSVAHALYTASTGLGFVYVTGHGISDESISAARQAAFAFFRSPEEQKRQVSVSPQHRGWLKPGESSMHANARPDLKESYIWGYQDNTGLTAADHPLQGPNQWPTWLPDIEPAAVEYYRQSHNVALDLMRGFAMGLNLSEDFFLQHCERPLSRASFVYYPAQSESCAEEQFGVAPHTDFGMLTVLCQDNVGGLQIQDVNGQWLEAPPIDGTLVINVGDLLSRWTGGIYHSTPHRVVNSSGKERLSLVLAFDPDPHTVIDANQLPHDQITTKEPPITCGDYLLWRFSKAFSYRR